GLEAAERAVHEGMRVNMTLCFTEEQAAAVYAATKGAKKGDVFVSPFVGRLDDRGERGMDLIENIVKLYESSDGHVEVLTASIRSLLHQEQALSLKSDILTTPLKILKEWKEADFSAVPSVPEADLAPIPFKEILLDKPWREYDIHHDLTDKGIERFAADWNALIA
ncbi:MAG: transaldolase, partial [Patescibacteria group bacterium]|nr:transaldolase [Patescibacteria group bacterium]